MKIQNNYSYKQSFKSNSRAIRDAKGVIINQNLTKFFRNQDFWDRFSQKLIGTYKNQTKVNIYSYGCSDGSEAFSLAMLLLNKVGGKKAQKFFPIIAKDIDETILTEAKIGKIRLSNSDLNSLDYFIGDNYKNYLYYNKDSFKYIPNYESTLCTGRIKKPLKDAVIFEQADLTKDVDNIKENNTIVIFRNLSPYIKSEEHQDLIKKLSNKLKDKCMIVIGALDDKIKPLIRNNNFETSDVDYCYIKK